MATRILGPPKDLCRAAVDIQYCAAVRASALQRATAIWAKYVAIAMFWTILGLSAWTSVSDFKCDRWTLWKFGILWQPFVLLKVFAMVWSRLITGFSSFFTHVSCMVRLLMLFDSSRMFNRLERDEKETHQLLGVLAPHIRRSIQNAQLPTDIIEMIEEELGFLPEIYGHLLDQSFGQMSLSALLACITSRPGSFPALLRERVKSLRRTLWVEPSGLCPWLRSCGRYRGKTCTDLVEIESSL